MHHDLAQCEPRVSSLQEAANQVLQESNLPEGAETACTRLTNLKLKLESLIQLTRVYVLKLGAVLGHQPSELSFIVPRNKSLDSLSHEVKKNNLKNNKHEY